MMQNERVWRSEPAYQPLKISPAVHLYSKRPIFPRKNFRKRWGARWRSNEDYHEDYHNYRLQLIVTATGFDGIPFATTSSSLAPVWMVDGISNSVETVADPVATAIVL
jgi:hypothetical protein